MIHQVDADHPSAPSHAHVALCLHLENVCLYEKHCATATVVEDEDGLSQVNTSENIFTSLSWKCVCVVVCGCVCSSRRDAGGRWRMCVDGGGWSRDCLLGRLCVCVHSGR